jgi:hypothetical protein
MNIFWQWNMFYFVPLDNLNQSTILIRFEYANHDLRVHFYSYQKRHKMSGSFLFRHFEKVL